MANLNERTDTAETSPDLFCIHAAAPTNKDRAPNSSCPLRNRNRAVHFVKLCGHGRNRPKHIANANERTDAPETNQDLFCIRASVAACQKGASNLFILEIGRLQQPWITIGKHLHRHNSVHVTSIPHFPYLTILLFFALYSTKMTRWQKQQLQQRDALMEAGRNGGSSRTQ
jgi:hypothetical protein